MREFLKLKVEQMKLKVEQSGYKTQRLSEEPLLFSDLEPLYKLTNKQGDVFHVIKNGNKRFLFTQQEVDAFERDGISFERPKE